MKKQLLLVTALFVALTTSAKAQGLFTGDVRLACEAILCLSSGARPSECTSSLNRYFSISLKKLSDTIKARGDFLELCPAASMNAGMSSLVDVIANGAGRCDARSLNATLIAYRGEGQAYVSNAMPPYCTVYTNNSYTDLSKSIPLYVGQPARGGNWVEEKDYARALAAYNARIAAEDRAAQQSSAGN